MRFQDIAERTSDWIWELDTEGKFIYSNPAVNKTIGYTSEEIIGKKASEILVQNSEGHAEPFLESVAREGGLFSVVRQYSLRHERVGLPKTTQERQPYLFWVLIVRYLELLLLEPTAIQSMAPIIPNRNASRKHRQGYLLNLGKTRWIAYITGTAAINPTII